MEGESSGATDERAPNIRDSDWSVRWAGSAT